MCASHNEFEFDDGEDFDAVGIDVHPDEMEFYGDHFEEEEVNEDTQRLREIIDRDEDSSDNDSEGGADFQFIDERIAPVEEDNGLLLEVRATAYLAKQISHIILS